MLRLGNISFNSDFVKSLKWTEFKSRFIPKFFKDDLEAYLFYRDLTGKKVAGMERKVNV